MQPVSKIAQRTLDRPGQFNWLSVEYIDTATIAVAHRVEQCGDLCADPEVTFWKGPGGQDQQFGGKLPTTARAA